MWAGLRMHQTALQPLNARSPRPREEIFNHKNLWVGPAGRGCHRWRSAAQRCEPDLREHRHSALPTNVAPAPTRACQSSERCQRWLPKPKYSWSAARFCQIPHAREADTPLLAAGLMDCGAASLCAHHVSSAHRPRHVAAEVTSRNGASPELAAMAASSCRRIEPLINTISGRCGNRIQPSSAYPCSGGSSHLSARQPDTDQWGFFRRRRALKPAEYLRRYERDHSRRAHGGKRTLRRGDESLPSTTTSRHAQSVRPATADRRFRAAAGLSPTGTMAMKGGNEHGVASSRLRASNHTAPARKPGNGTEHEWAVQWRKQRTPYAAIHVPPPPPADKVV